MKKKNGFTLVELLAVISILAILVLISMPAIMSMFRNARKDTFLNEVRSMLTGAESAFLSETLKNNKINVVASNEEFVNVANSNLKEGETAKVSGKMDYKGKNIDYYIELDNQGKPVKYVFTDGTFAVFSIKGKTELEKTDVIEETIDIKNYVGEFNIKAPNFATFDTYLKDADMFNFRAENLINPDGSVAASWTTTAKDQNGNDVSITGYIKNVNNQQVIPIIKNNALVLPGGVNKYGYNTTKIAIRFDKMPYKFKSFTLEGTFKLYEYGSGYTNIISNVNSGGYYLNISSSDHKASIGVCDNSQAHDSKCYIQCKSKQSLNLNETYVITATYNDATKKTALYINGEKAETQKVSNRTGAVSNSDSNNECYISEMGVRYPEPLVPLTIGGNPSQSGFDDAEWFSGEIYLARIYNGVLSPDEIQNNYYSNMMTVKGYSQNANVLSLNGGGLPNQIEKYQYSLDEGNTWLDYETTNMPIIGYDTWVYARTVSKLGVISSTSKKYYDIEEE